MSTKKRPDADRPRERFLHAVVTEDEYKEIVGYCHKKHTSLSQFFADLMLKEASKPRTTQQQSIAVRLDLTQAEYDKLELLARLHKKSIGDYVHETLEPEFRLQRIHTHGKTRLVRYYLSDEEYERVAEYMNATGIDSRNHPAILALRAIRKSGK